MIFICYKKLYFFCFQIFCSTVFFLCHLACLECRKRAKKEVNVEEGTSTLPQQSQSNSQPGPVTSQPQTAITTPTISQPPTCLVSTPTTCQNGTLLLINTPLIPTTSVQRVASIRTTTAPVTTTTATTFSPLFGTLIFPFKVC